ncbi:M23 family metallopeptidase [Actinokineospora auranticolor]|nr:M23 family metallopeptidase [Actinokineospora auranticolor]
MPTDQPKRRLFGLICALLALLTSATPLSAAPPAPPPAAATTPPAFLSPLQPPRPPTRAFQAPATPYGPGHRGVDLPGAANEQVHAAADGLITYAADLAGRGVIAIDHPNHLRTTYEPVTPTVTAGAAVLRGEQIGLLQPGHPGCPPATPACLHWGLRRGRTYLNPMFLLHRPRVRLLPDPVAAPGRGPP